MPVDIVLYYVELVGWYVAAGVALLSSPGEASDADVVVSSGSGDIGTNYKLHDLLTGSTLL